MNPPKLKSWLDFLLFISCPPLCGRKRPRGQSYNADITKLPSHGAEEMSAVRELWKMIIHSQL